MSLTLIRPHRLRHPFTCTDDAAPNRTGAWAHGRSFDLGAHVRASPGWVHTVGRWRAWWPHAEDVACAAIAAIGQVGHHATATVCPHLFVWSRAHLFAGSRAHLLAGSRAHLFAWSRAHPLAGSREHPARATGVTAGRGHPGARAGKIVTSRPA
ncbi:hypothetical protein Aca07nite_79020 [Actinoplanes capillaceus]|uniref:Uncharacterized protein n=1 Tax=Actinoplanes campanulatus TaxID=113559 RepID=A0ABQ3WWN2_9ACTN|nr:hypothetical protein Aca07nite_79020 [Actinoplanes capillaceus]